MYNPVLRLLTVSICSTCSLTTGFPFMSSTLTNDGVDTRIVNEPFDGFGNNSRLWSSDSSAVTSVAKRPAELQLKTSHPPIAVLLQVMFAAPFSDDMYRPL